MVGDGDHAWQSCLACKKLKRKCDKLSPSCSLCRRTGRRCEYGAPESAPTASDFAELQARIAQLEEYIGKTEHMIPSPQPSSQDLTTPGRFAESPFIARIESSPDFPAALFLDIDCYKWAGLKLPRPPVAIPMDVLAVLGHENTLVDISKAYFESVHQWFPLVSRKRMDTGTALWNGGPDLALLFLSMKLITTDFEAATQGESSLYSTAKTFLASLEAGGLVSFHCLQGMTFIALFEYSHAIYPAAWMTIGACARYAEMLGLTCGNDTLGVMPKSSSWMEIEERRRQWWAIFVLDRVCSLGSKRRFAIAELPNGILPASDAAWETGNLAQAMPLPPANPHRLPVPPFAQLCQAAILIDRAAACRANTSKESQLAEVETLVTEILAFQANIRPACSRPVEGLKAIPTHCLSVSALFFLLDTYTCPEKLSDQPGYEVTGEAKDPTEHAMQVRATELIQQASRDVHSLCQDLLHFLDISQGLSLQTSPDIISPMAFDAMYCAIATLHWNSREGTGDIDLQRLHEMNSCLDKLGERWKLAQKYRTLGDYHDYTAGVR